MANLPLYLPHPFQRAAWHIRAAHGPDHPRAKAWYDRRGHRHEGFWPELASFIESAGHALAETGGSYGTCDEPGSIRTAENLALAYLAALTPDELAKIPADLHS